jgi:DUF4097 and DUF4098 domain-containing protein YvlB
VAEHTRNQETTAMQETFDTPTPTDLYVELGSGDLDVRCEAVTLTTVHIDGKDADDVVVEQRGNQIVVLAKQRKTGFFSSSNELSVHVTMPTSSTLSTKLGSADVNVSGRLGEAMVKTGSGDVALDEVEGNALLETGSGDIEIDTVEGELRIKSGSGDIEVDHVDGAANISTGSGDVQIGTATGAVQVKSGSGDMRVREAKHDVALSTASGDLYVDRVHRGQLSAKNVSGDIKVGVPAGIPVWTDISSVTGSVRSNLQGAGQPEEGQDFLELRAKTVSGDVYLEEL